MSETKIYNAAIWNDEAEVVVKYLEDAMDARHAVIMAIEHPGEQMDAMEWFGNVDCAAIYKLIRQISEKEEVKDE